ncbi:MAG: ECF transporter S component [Acetatifactor sp.]|nr:ECF transporter S component [Acetatifactor sp.]
METTQKDVLSKKSTAGESTVRLTIAALFMGLNIVLSSSIFSIPVPGGHLYMCDIPICIAALLLNPFEAFVVAGVGSFIGDFLFYPAPMFVSLFTHGLQAVVISLIAQRTFKHNPKLAAIIAVTVGAVIMVIGYSLGRAYVYATPEYAILKLPYEILQAVVGAVLGVILNFRFGVRKLFNKYVYNTQ